MQAIYAQMRADSPNLTAVFGGHCSGALMAMSSVEHRAAIGGPQHLFISGSSTAPSAADDVKYPNVARMASSEALIAVAIADLCIDQGWKRVGVVWEGAEPWSIESAAFFREAFSARGGNIIEAPSQSKMLDRSQCMAADGSAARSAALLDHHRDARTLLARQGRCHSAARLHFAHDAPTHVVLAQVGLAVA